MSSTQLGLDGFFQLEVRDVIGVDESGVEILSKADVVAPWFGNLVTDYGLNALGAVAGNNLTYCRIGTGTTPPAFADTALTTQVGFSNAAGVTVTSGVAADRSYIYRRVSRRFSSGTISGVALSEIGMSTTSSSSLFCRTLIKDGAGGEATVTLTPTQVLDVIYELRYYLPTQGQTVVADIDGVSTTVTINYYDITNSWESWVMFIGSNLYPDLSSILNTRYGAPLETAPTPTGVNGFAGTMTGTTVSFESYVPFSHQIIATVTIGLTAGNFATGIGCMMMAGNGGGGGDSRWRGGYGWWLYNFNPKIAKTASTITTIVVGVSWGRYSIP